VASTWPSEVPFAALLAYSPKGRSERSAKSRRVCYGIKRGDTQLLVQAVTVLGQVFAEAGFDEFLRPDVGLVPAPGSAPHVPGGLWPAELIAKALVGAKRGGSVLPYLHRKEAVPKSAFAAPGERPTVERHYATITVDRELVVPKRLVLVDDVITRGRTLLSCARLLQEAFPSAEVRCFGMIRTMGLHGDVERIVDPCKGRIYWTGRDADREP
jgi:hypothetical protein